MTSASADPDRIGFDAVLVAAAELQGLVPDAVLVGGSAAAAHAGHRISLDADHVLEDLRARFDDVIRALEENPEWVTARVMPNVQLLGRLRGIETGLRQLRRTRPLETTIVHRAGVDLRVPTMAEMLRIKCWLVLDRNAYRDYLDVAGLASALGAEAAVAALQTFQDCYRDLYRAEASRDVSPLLELARRLAEPAPYDLAGIDPRSWRGVRAPFDDWDRVREMLLDLAVRLRPAEASGAAG